MVARKLQPHERIDRDVLRRYSVGKRIGRGFYGVVWEGTQLDGDRQDCGVAVKKILYAFRNATDAQRTYREVSYLLEFGDHENILKVYDVLCSADDRHLYLITDLLDSDLAKALRCQSLRAIHRPLIAYQILLALKYIHSAGVMHRDVKPSNVLLNASCQVVLADFGWARTALLEDDVGDAAMTDYASTRWYRSPEMLLGARRYTTAVDLWALACVVGEMHLERALFPGTSTLDMVGLFVLALGKPLASDVASLEAAYGSCSLDSLPPMPAHKPMDVVFHGDSNELIDFLKLTLQWNPYKRLTVDEALRHSYLSAFANPDDEPTFGLQQVLLAVPDSRRLSAGEYRDQLYADVIGMTRAQRQVERQRIWRLMMEDREDIEAPPQPPPPALVQPLEPQG
mmetsp:Transcript_82908/g.256291  ORF Transcript_82908/g.256291 Transcript_82908/m.256291 type:complete len:398 (+) Transcript_82908:1-1194(+)